MDENKIKIKKDLFRRIRTLKGNSKNRGITLIALIITIIAILIIAGVSISMLLGENGLINRARFASDNYRNSQIEEEKALNDMYGQIQIATSGTVTLNLESLEKIILNKTYPIGSIYISMGETSPETLFGGKWEKIEDKFLLANGSTFGANTSGGSANLEYTPKGTVEPHKLTVSEIPSHMHEVMGPTSHYIGANYGTTSDMRADVGGYGFSVTGTYDNKAYGGQRIKAVATGGNGSHSHAFTGTKENIDNMPPYMTVYMWKRIE